jgi:deoxyribodipyrimidine photolyase-related protein
MNIHTVRLILGDQLNHKHSWFTTKDEGILYVMMEVYSELYYTTHHIQKIIGFFAAMRSFADQLRQQGHNIYYITLDDLSNKQSITANLQQICHLYQCSRIEYQMPDEYRLEQELSMLKKIYTVHCADTEHFLCTAHEWNTIFPRKKYLLETFYRAMRRKYSILMDSNDKPATGTWNYDQENRSGIKKGLQIPAPLAFDTDIQYLHQMIQKHGIPTIGTVDSQHFSWPVNRDQSLQMLDYFIAYLLPSFGTYQDAMSTKHRTLFHSRLSFALNIKLIHPLEICHAVERAWRENPEIISIAQAEGFIRQILGWREYMRCIYRAEMPAYKLLNFFDHQNSLPEWYWNGNTKMNCLHMAIKQSLEDAYAHHIQRLMITGNFSLLAGVHPDYIDAWYLGIYIDALEWVEITNTRGMSQYADGGIVGTKPYISTAQYINKMSDYCADCYYDKSLRYGHKACPFNSLHWNFYEKNRHLLNKNPRTAMMYRVLDRMEESEKGAILKQAAEYMAQIEQL